MPKLLSSHAATTEACVPSAHALQQEKSPRQEACVPQLESGPFTQTRESSHVAK